MLVGSTLRAVDAKKLAIEILLGADCSVNALRLTSDVRVCTAHDDAAMVWPLAMQTLEITPIDRDNRPVCSDRIGQHVGILNPLIVEPCLTYRQDIVSVAA